VAFSSACIEDETKFSSIFFLILFSKLLREPTEGVLFTRLPNW
jgi:hypothetical protein